MGNNVTNLASVCRPRRPGKEVSRPPPSSQIQRSHGKKPAYSADFSGI